MFSDATVGFGIHAPVLPVPSGLTTQAGLLETLLTQSWDATLVVEAQTPDLAAFRILYANPACTSFGLRGTPRGQRLGRALTIFQKALAEPTRRERIHECLTAGLPVRDEALTGKGGGKVRCALLDISPLPASAPSSSAPTLWLVTLRDRTEQNRIAEALKQKEDDDSLLFQSSPQPMWIYDIKTLAFLAVNDAAACCYGYTESEFLRMSVADLHPHEDLPSLLAEIAQSPTGMQSSGPRRQLCRDGSELWAEVCSQPIVFHRLAARIAVATNATERRRVQAESEQLLTQTKHLLSEAVERADRDPLTGLLNHRAFHKRLEQESETARRSGQPLAIAMMDLDNFKFFNDGYGHSIGDDLLRQVTRALSSACRPGDTLARYGGDEFALLLPGLGAEGAVRLADRLIAGLDGVGYRPPGYDTVLPLTLSIGIAVFPDDGPGRLDALAAADTRLACVKSGGAGRTELVERLREQLPCSLADFSMLNALVTAVDAKDRYTRRHSEDVMAYSFEIVQELGMDEPTQRRTLLAALLHDVGKIGVPDAVLRKPGKLTASEYEAIKQHPMMGAIMVGALPGFDGALDAIRHHHERWDGQGYPFGLQGDAIPLLARIMAVADAFSAMTTDRPYRKGMSSHQALSLLQAGAGTQWDPVCIAAFAAARRKMDGLDCWPEES